MFWFKAKTLGELGEHAAAKHYRSLGYTVVAKRFFNRHGKQLGEIDLVVVKGNYLVFVEVKTRAQEYGKFGSGFEAVNRGKQEKLIKIGEYFLQKHPKYKDFYVQIDVCAVAMDQIDNKILNVTILPNAVDDYR